MALRPINIIIDGTINSLVGDGMRTSDVLQDVRRDPRVQRLIKSAQALGLTQSDLLFQLVNRRIKRMGFLGTPARGKHSENIWYHPRFITTARFRAIIDQRRLLLAEDSAVIKGFEREYRRMVAVQAATGRDDVTLAEVRAVAA